MGWKAKGCIATLNVAAEKEAFMQRLEEVEAGQCRYFRAEYSREKEQL
jgi:hypothetical protein